MSYDLLNRVERYFLIPGWAILVLGYLGMRLLKKESLKAYRIGLVLLVASLIWALVMPQHFIVHTFTTKQVGLFYGFIVGYGLWAYWLYCREAFRKRKWPLMVMHTLFIGYILVMFLSQQVWQMYVKYGFGLLF